MNVNNQNMISVANCIDGFTGIGNLANNWKSMQES